MSNLPIELPYDVQLCHGLPATRWIAHPPTWRKLRLPVLWRKPAKRRRPIRWYTFVDSIVVFRGGSLRHNADTSNQYGGWNTDECRPVISAGIEHAILHLLVIRLSSPGECKIHRPLCPTKPIDAVKCSVHPMAW